MRTPASCTASMKLCRHTGTRSGIPPAMTVFTRSSEFMASPPGPLVLVYATKIVCRARPGRCTGSIAFDIRTLRNSMPQHFSFEMSAGRPHELRGPPLQKDLKTKGESEQCRRADQTWLVILIVILLNPHPTINKKREKKK